MTKHVMTTIRILITAVVVIPGCTTGVKQTTFLHPAYDFSYVEKVAVVPFENLSEDQGAAARATRYYVTGLLATEAFEVVEPGEVSRVLAQYGIVRTAELTQERAVEIGKQLDVQGLFLGSVAESAQVGGGTSSYTVVTLDVHLLETDTGVSVWSSTHTKSGRGFWSSLFGTGQRSVSEVTRKCVQESIDSLVR